MKGLWSGCRGKGKKRLQTLSLLSLLLMSKPIFAQNQLEDIDIKIDVNNKIHLMLTLKDKSIGADFEKKPHELVLFLENTVANANLLGERELLNIGRLLNGLTIKNVDDKVELRLSTQSHFTYDYFQTNNLLSLQLMPTLTRTIQKPKKSASKNISLNFQDIPVRSVLQMVAEHNGFNLVVADSVSGALTLRLDNVPWQKALDTILKVKGLDQRQMGNILLVAPKAELDEQERQLLEKRQKERELASLTSEVIQVNYANAEDLKEMLDGDEEDEKSVSLLSKRGSIAVDPRTNSLIVRDLSENIDVLKSLIAALDIPVEQVEIEARIVTVDEGTLDEIGVRWGLQNTNGSFSTSGTINGLPKNGTTSTNIDDKLNVNLGVVNPNAGSIAFQVANLGKDLLLDLELSALQAESRAEIISSPRLLTTNKRAAYIEQGTELPYLEAASSGAASVSFKKAVLSLSVTPQITNSNKLVLDLEVTQDKPGATVKAGTGEAMAINTQRIGTQVLVNDGETIVLGGIYQHEMMESVDKVPLFGDLPGIGHLFRRDYETLGKRELLIFVTPRIVIQ